jgi:two-component system, OmpR family, catabolic regulation response regulator CreB
MKTALLLVEDDPAIAETVQIALTTQGYAVTWVGLGQAAIELLKNQPAFALVMLDVGLPDLSGFEVCRTVRQHSNVPVLFLTAHSDEIDRIQGFEVGADDYLAKPFSLRELAARVRAIVRRQTNFLDQHSMPSLSCGPLTHFKEQARITLREQALNLTRTEYLLLEHLMTHPRRVFNRDQLLDAVRGSGSPTGDRAIDTHIKTLRTKLAAIDTAFDPIATHRGFGYSLNLGQS